MRRIAPILFISTLIFGSCAHNYRVPSEARNLERCGEIIASLLQNSEVLTKEDLQTFFLNTVKKEDLVEAINRVPEDVEEEWVKKRLLDSPYFRSMGFGEEETKSVIAQAVKEGKSLRSINELLDSMAYKMDAEVPILKERNQCNSGTCWIQSSMAATEKTVGLKEGASDVFMWAQHIRTQVRYHLSRVKLPTYSREGRIFMEGGSFHQLFQYIGKVGLIPDGVWKPKKAIYEKEVKEELFQKLNSVLEEFFTNKQNMDNKSDEYKAYKKEIGKKLDEIMNEYFELPKKIVVDEVEYTPKEWAEAFFDTSDFQISRIEKMIQDLSPKQKEAFLAKEEKIAQTAKEKAIKRAGEDATQGQIDDEEAKAIQELRALPMKKGVPEVEVNVRNESIEKIESLIVERINKGEPVYMAFDSPGKEKGYFVSTEEGNIRVPYFNNETRITSVAERVPPAKIKGGHAVTVVGYKLDSQGRISRLKYYNSQDSHLGYFTMNATFFQRFLNHIYLLEPKS